MIVDDNYVTKSNLTITVKTLTKYNDRSKVAAKQTNKQTDSVTNIWAEKLKKKTYLQLDLLLLQLELHLLSTHIQKEVNKK